MRLLKRLCGPLSIALQIEAKLLCSCLCLFGAIFGLHAMGEKILSHWKVKVDFICNRGLLNYFMIPNLYLGEAFITLNLKA
jgi:hypothetical protein